MALLILGSVIDHPLAQGPVKSPPSLQRDMPPGIARAVNLNPLNVLDTTLLDGFKGRPLFAPSRRPLPPPQAVIAPSAPVLLPVPPPDLRLVGVVAGTDKAVAILRRPAGGPSLNLKVGDTVDAWRVDAIGPDRVSLRDGEREKTYRLFSVGGLSSQQPASRITNIPPLGSQSAR